MVFPNVDTAPAGPTSAAPNATAAAARAAHANHNRLHRRLSPTVTVHPVTKTLTLGKAGYTLTGGESKTLTVTLSASGQKLLSEHHKLPALVSLTATGATQPSDTKKVTITPLVCGVPAHEQKLARDGKVYVWADYSVENSGSGNVYACSPQHPKGVTLLSFDAICMSPTGCGDALTANVDVRFAGQWVAVAGQDNEGDYGGFAVWDTKRSRPAQSHSFYPQVQGAYDPALRSDGAAAYAYQTLGKGGSTVDLLYACDSGCPSLKRVASYTEPSSYQGTRALLSSVRFGFHDLLRWTEDGVPESVPIR
jgi:hypothetical protein